MTASMSVSSSVRLFLDHRSLTVKPDSLELYGRWLDLWQRWRREAGYADDLHAVTQDELLEFFHYLKHDHIPHASNTHRPAADRRGLAPASRDGVWRVLRTMWRHLNQRRMLLDDQVDFFRFGAVPRPPVPTDPRPSYSKATLEALIEACANNDREAEKRDRAILLILFESGLRVSELCSLNDEDIDLVERQARVLGKGDQWGHVFWAARGDSALRQYLHVRRGGIGGARPLFRGTNSRNDGGRLTDDAIRSMMRRLAERAGVKLVEGAPVHAVRHSFAHHVLDQGFADLQLMQLMRHKDIRTTQRYSGENPKGLRKIHRRIKWDDERDDR